MIQSEEFNGVIRHYSDRNKIIRQIETGELYYDAVDIIPCQYTYEETEDDIPDFEIDDDLILSYILGKKDTMTWQQAQKYRALINSIIENLEDAEALAVLELFVPWENYKLYNINDKIKYEDNLYKCIQSHTSQSDWTPDITPSLWTRISVEEWPEWVQPTGAPDSYMTGDKVSHNEKHWISQYDNNVWEPGVFGWEEVI